MDEIRDIFLSVDGALPERPFASFTGPPSDGRAAVAAGTLAAPDGRHYVAYLEKPTACKSASPVCYVDEDLRLETYGVEDDAQTRSGYRVRYLEAFERPFEAGERYRFFWEALHPQPEELDTDTERERDLARGLKRIEELIRDRAVGALCEEVLHAEESTFTRTRARTTRRPRSASRRYRTPMRSSPTRSGVGSTTGDRRPSSVRAPTGTAEPGRKTSRTLRTCSATSAVSGTSLESPPPPGRTSSNAATT